MVYYLVFEFGIRKYIFVSTSALSDYIYIYIHTLNSLVLVCLNNYYLNVCY